MNIDAGRIGVETRTYALSGAPGGNGVRLRGGDGRDAENARRYAEQSRSLPPKTVEGRWPAHLVLTHLPGCRVVGSREVRNTSGSVEGDEPSHTGDEHTVCYGEFNRVRFERHGGEDGVEIVPEYACAPGCPVAALDGQGEAGMAARFFFQADWSAETAEALAAADPVFYTAKASRAEREAGLESLARQAVGDGRKQPIDNPYQRGRTERLNTHPTIKPLRLAHWLASLLLPPALYAPRRLLVPFSGAGSEMIGALLAGWDEIQGIELETPYAALSWLRLSFWSGFADLSGIDDLLSRALAAAREAGDGQAQPDETDWRDTLFEPLMTTSEEH